MIEKCPYCGAEIRPDKNFCSNCGHRLLPAHSPGASPGEGGWLILRSDSGETLHKYPLDRSKTVIGRGPNSDISLPKDLLTSKYHATVYWEDGRYILRDEQSANGTFVNGQQLEEGASHYLKDGDQVIVGEHEFIFRSS